MLIKNAIYLERLAIPRRGVGENTGRMGKEESVRVHRTEVSCDERVAKQTVSLFAFGSTQPNNPSAYNNLLMHCNILEYAPL